MATAATPRADAIPRWWRWCRTPPGLPIACHRTYLTREGRKASVEPPKASLGPVWAGAIRLDPAAPEIVVGEGIESSASAGLLLGLPAWAALSAGNLARALILPPEVRGVVIAADRDPVGMQAAQAAATRWRAEGRRVRIARPDNAGQDFNDVLAARMVAASAMPRDDAGYSIQEVGNGLIVLPPRYSDDALANTFSARHDGQMLYVPAWSSWLQWNGSKWAKDDVLAVFDAARIICRETAADAAGEKNGESIAKAITSASTVSAVERLARSDPRHARAADAFDADPWLLKHARWRRQPSHRPHATAQPRRYAHQGCGCHARRFVSALDQVLDPDHAGQSQADPLPTALHRLHPHRLHHRTRLPVLLRSRRQRERRPVRHRASVAWRLRHHCHARRFHGGSQRSAPHQPCRTPGRPAWWRSPKPRKAASGPRRASRLLQAATRSALV